MKCEHCGTEHALGKRITCRDALKAKLASMTKRAEEAEVWGQDTVCRLTNEKDAAEAKLASMTKRAEEAERANANYVEMTKGAIGQASDDAARASFNLRRAEAAEAKLATAVEGLREIAGRALSYAGWAAECARSTLRALDIDPSKETGK